MLQMIQEADKAQINPGHLNSELQSFLLLMPSPRSLNGF